MSLRVWLPLNGTLDNQGLDNVVVANNGATVVSNGKIGKCYGFDGSDDRIYANNILLNNSAMSACCWVKLSSINNSYSYIFALGSNTTGNGIQIGLAIWKSDSKLRLVGHGAGPASNYIPPLNTWIHLCMTISGTLTKLYVNGILTDTQTNSNSPKTQNCLCIGARPNSTSGAGVSFSYPLNGYINDFRLYDHALSAQEVKKIAQGLVLHFPLDRNGWGNENILPNSLTRQISPYQVTNYTRTSNITVSEWACLNAQKISGSGGTNLIVGIIGASQTSEDGVYYSYSIYVKNNHATKKIRFRTNNGSIYSDWVNPNEAKRITAINAIGNGTNYLAFNFVTENVGDAFDFTYWKPKIEKGGVVTTWCPNSADGIANSLNINSNIVYDISGFKNDGVSIGTIGQEENSPKYGSSAVFNGVNTCIKNPNFIFTSNIWSISFWYYYDTAPTAWETLVCLAKGNGADENKKMALQTNTGKIWIKSENGSGTYSSLNIQKWTYLVLTCDGVNGKLYENGVLKLTSSAISSTFTDCVNLGIGARSSVEGMATVTSFLKGKMSDVRIYATVLSAADIKELYEYNGLG